MVTEKVASHVEVFRTNKSQCEISGCVLWWVNPQAHRFAQKFDGVAYVCVGLKSIASALVKKRDSGLPFVSRGLVGVLPVVVKRRGVLARV